MVILSATLVALGVAYAMALVHFTRGFRSLVKSWKPTRSDDLPSVAVIIAARNEEVAIRACLESVLTTDYPAEALEVVVVDDDSTDRTASIVSDLAAQFVNLRKITLPRDATGRGGKRRAIEAGIAGVDSPIILLTDADCVVPTRWIRSIVSTFTDRTRFVAGPVVYSSGKTWLGRLMELELLGLVAIGAGAIARGHPNMCNGANIAFLRRAFIEAGGYAGTDHITSGDDELLMQKIARQHPDAVRFCPDLDAVVTTTPPQGLSAWLQQRRRWASKGLHYDDRRVTLLALLVYGLNLMLVVGIVVAMLGFNMGASLAATVLLKLGAEAWMFWSVCGWFGRRYLLAELVPGQLIEIPYVVYVGAAGTMGGYRWKGRHIQR